MKGEASLQLESYLIETQHIAIYVHVLHTAVQCCTTAQPNIAPALLTLEALNGLMMPNQLCSQYIQCDVISRAILKTSVFLCPRVLLQLQPSLNCHQVKTTSRIKSGGARQFKVTVETARQPACEPAHTSRHHLSCCPLFIRVTTCDCKIYRHGKFIHCLQQVNSCLDLHIPGLRVAVWACLATLHSSLVSRKVLGSNPNRLSCNAISSLMCVSICLRASGL